jgi:hypothetical protein
MIINDLNLFCPPFTPDETDAPLIVDADTIFRYVFGLVNGFKIEPSSYSWIPGQARNDKNKLAVSFYKSPLNRHAKPVA